MKGGWIQIKRKPHCSNTGLARQDYISLVLSAVPSAPCCCPALYGTSRVPLDTWGFPQITMLFQASRAFLESGILPLTQLISSPPYLVHSVLSFKCWIMSPLGSPPSESFLDVQLGAVPPCFQSAHGISLLEYLPHGFVIVCWFVCLLPCPWSQELGFVTICPDSDATGI